MIIFHKVTDFTIIHIMIIALQTWCVGDAAEKNNRVQM